jgi:hypothetical protein
MPGAEIKTALKTLLAAAFVAPTGDGRLKHVSGHYPRESELSAPGDFPQAYVWCGDHDPESIEAGGASRVVTPGPTPAVGIRHLVWTARIHVKHLLNDPLGGAGDDVTGDEFDALIDDIESMLRQYPTLNAALGTQAAGTGYGARDWKVEWSGAIERETVPPLPVNEMQIAYNAFVSLRVREQVRA